MSKFVLSKSEFPTLKAAEGKVTEWFKKGSLKDKQVRAYKIVEIYELKLKFEKIKK